MIDDNGCGVSFCKNGMIAVGEGQMSIMLKSFVRVVLCGLCLGFGTTTACGSENAVKNSSFEAGTKTGPAGWERKTYSGNADFLWAPVARSGDHSAALSSAEGVDVGWRNRVPVEPYSIYRLSGWIKTEDVKAITGLGAHIKVHGVDNSQTRFITGTVDWTEVELEFSSDYHRRVTVEAGLGGYGRASGKAWFDDIQLYLQKPLDINSPQVTVDLGTEIGGMSPYIYGQFIEHVGRCIYGGIWAEMLKERKFYNLVGSRYSPWKRLGGEVGWSLTMDVKRPYVNNWSVKISVTDRACNDVHGVIQGGLGVVEGAEYVGHVVAAGNGKLEATLAWPDGASGYQTVIIDNIGADFAAVPIRFRAGGSTDNASLSLGMRGEGEVWIGAVSVMPADNIKGMRADTVKLLRELGSPIYRWPGGNFVSGYDWRDGIGPRDKRPTRKNAAWKELEYNDFGIDEFITLCREIGAEPLVVVNSGLGSPELASALVEYCNGDPDTRYGSRRASHGRGSSYHVKWWGVGNEMWGGFQLGHTSLQNYVTRHNEFVRAMRAVDPEIKCVAVGGADRGAWSETMLSRCADTTDLISEHFYVKAPNKDLGEHVFRISESVRRKVKWQRHLWQTLPMLRDRKIPIALDEWNYWYGREIYGQLGVRYYLRDALGIASGIHEMARNPDVFQMANYAQTVNVIGCIKTTKKAAAFATTALPLMLYRRHFGTISVKVSKAVGPVDVQAALTEDRSKVTVGIVNASKSEKTVKLDFVGGEPASEATRFLITGQNEMAYNAPGRPPNVVVAETDGVAFDPNGVRVPPVSVTLYVVDIVR
jgi:alpha-N-arabinofuranosidase